MPALEEKHRCDGGGTPCSQGLGTRGRGSLDDAQEDRLGHGETLGYDPRILGFLSEIDTRLYISVLLAGFRSSISFVREVLSCLPTNACWYRANGMELSIQGVH